MDAKTFGQIELFKREIAELTQEKYTLIKRVKELSEERDELLRQQKQKKVKLFEKKMLSH